MKLSITIPAYNEEQAIVPIIERCLAAREALLRDTDLSAVDIVVVSDGSTDATVARAEPYARDGRIALVAYQPNAGYGAALKRGFAASDGDLVGFLDADGTCDPLHFVPLVNACLREGADVACGCRMTRTSKMPPLRKLGNLIFRAIINYLARTSIRDSASGMRVMRRASLAKLYPLPDGMHFTPAMSCRASLDPRITMREVDMHYEERIGRSKLRVVKDGLRFLKVIVDVALTYRPLRIFGSFGLLLLALALGLGLSIAHAKFVDPGYAHLPRWYLFRMLTALTAAASGLTLLMVGLVAERVAMLVQRHQPPPGLLHGVVLRLLRNKTLFALGALLALSGVVLNQGTLGELLDTGHIEVERWWSYVITGAFLVITGVELMGIAIVDRVILLLRATEEDRAADLVASAPRASGAAPGPGGAPAAGPEGPPALEGGEARSP